MESGVYMYVPGFVGVGGWVNRGGLSHTDDSFAYSY